MDTETLREFLKINSNNEVDDSSHSKLITMVTGGLSRLGIAPDAELFRKVALKNTNIDLVALTEDEVYLVQCKALTEARKNKGIGRHFMEPPLNDGYEFFRRDFGVAPMRIGVYKRTTDRDFGHFIIPRPIDDYMASRLVGSAGS